MEPAYKRGTTGMIILRAALPQTAHHNKGSSTWFNLIKLKKLPRNKYKEMLRQAIFLIFLLFSLESTNGEKFSPAWSDESIEASMEASSSSEEDVKDTIFENLKSLFRSGDADYDIPPMAPYVDDEFYVGWVLILTLVADNASNGGA